MSFLNKTLMGGGIALVFAIYSASATEQVAAGATFYTSRLNAETKIINSGTVIIDSNISGDITLEDGSPAGQWIEYINIENGDADYERYPEVNKVKKLQRYNITPDTSALQNYRRQIQSITSLGAGELLDLVEKVEESEVLEIAGGNIAGSLGNAEPPAGYVAHSVRFVKDATLSGDNRFLTGTEINSATVTFASPNSLPANEIKCDKGNIALNASGQSFTLPINLSMKGGKFSVANNTNLVIPRGRKLTLGTSHCEKIEVTEGMKLSVARHYLAAASIGDYAIFAGGNVGGGYRNEVDIYKLDGDKIMKVSDTSWLNLSVGRERLAAASIGDYAIFAGGFAGGYGGGFTNAVDIYHLTGSGIERLDISDMGLELSKARAYLAAAIIGDYAIFAGGTDGGSYRNEVDIYKLDGGEIMKVSDTSGFALSVARHSLAAASIGDYAIFAGGNSSGGLKDTVDIYHLNSYGKIEKVDSNSLNLSFARRYLAAASIGNYAIFAGGYVGSGNYSNAVDIYKLEGGKITKVTDTVERLSVARGYLAAASIGNYAIFAGGYDGSNHSDAVDIYKLEGDKVTKVSNTSGLEFSVARHYLAAASIGDYAMFAGGNGSGGHKDTVDIYKFEELNTLQTETY